MNVNVILQIIYYTIAKHAVENLDVDPMDLSILRTGFLCVISGLLSELLNKKQWTEIEAGMFKFVIVRSVAGAIGYGSLVYSIVNLPMMVGVIIINTNPFFCAFLAYFYLKESVTKHEIICMIGCFVGIIILSLSKDKQTSTLSELTGLLVPQNHFIGFLASIMCSFFSAIVYVVTRRTKNIHFSIMLFHYGWIATPLFMLWSLSKWLMYSDKPYPSIFYLQSHQLLLILFVSIMNFGA